MKGSLEGATTVRCPLEGFFGALKEPAVRQSVFTAAGWSPGLAERPFGVVR